MAAAPAQQTEPSRAQQIATAAAAAGAAAAAVSAAPSPSSLAALPLVPAEQVARATAMVLASALAFLDGIRGRDDAFLRELLSVRTRNERDIVQAAQEEVDRGREFVRLTTQRLQVDLPLALSVPDPVERERAVRGILAREERFSRQRTEAMSARAVATVDRLQLRRDSPQGAYWKSDPNVIEHTAGCLVMSGGGRGRGRFWPWVVLDKVHPPRHPGCPCRLHSYGEAVRRGWLRAGDVMDVTAAVTAARGVVMEAASLDPQELVLREALIGAGLTTADRFDAVAGAVA